MQQNLKGACIKFSKIDSKYFQLVENVIMIIILITYTVRVCVLFLNS